ncbi:MAG: Gfo/Idh/MocA family oxidoreductase [Lacunisphaera sp.]|nr:Gfo/Idh/MocA family oxidoreductase [Lacunisphaera sp.]
MATAPLGFGLIGAGTIAGFHAQAIAQLTGARLVGVASRSLANARKVADPHGVFATADTAALLARPDLHIVCITTPSGAHLEPALAAIRAGKHVVIEKPIEITPARADQILDAAEQAGVRVAPIFQGRFGDGARTVKAALDAGRLGRLVLASAYVKWHRTAQYYTGYRGSLGLDGGGAVINQAIHGLDLLQWFAGLPAEVFAWKTRCVHTGIEAEDTAAAALRFPGGALGAFEASTALWPGWSRRIELCGEHGSISLEDDRIAKWEFRAARPEDDAIRTGGAANALGSGASDPKAISTEGHRRQLQDLVDALRADRAPAIDGREGRKAVAFVHALYASAESGQPVKL